MTLTWDTAYAKIGDMYFSCGELSRRELQPINFGHYRTRPRFSVCNYAMEYSQLLPVLSVNDTYMGYRIRKNWRYVFFLRGVKPAGTSTNQFWSLSDATKIFGL